MIARSLTETAGVVLPSDKDSAAPTKFRIRSLPHRVVMALSDLKKGSEHVELLVRAGVAGWEGFADPDGHVVAAKHLEGSHLVHGVQLEAPLDAASYDAIPFEALAELAHEILVANQLTTDEVGN